MNFAVAMVQGWAVTISVSSPINVNEVWTMSTKKRGTEKNDFATFHFLK